MVRRAAVSGQFYPSAKASLLNQIEGFIDKTAEKTDAFGAIMPHAGYVYSGLVAGQTASSFLSKDRYILIGPNHTGFGKPFSIMTEGIWDSPLGKVEIDSSLAGAILTKSKFLKEDSLAHTQEHSIEVEIPFLQYFKPDFKFVPIAVFPAELKIYKEIAQSIAKAIEEFADKKRTMIIASSDMTHYEPQEAAHYKDKIAIDAILKLDEDELFDKVKDLDISMCGYAPAVIMLAATKILGAKKAKLIKYQTSGDVSGDYSAVVGYAGVIVY
ncbi:MAG TPA: AmmeMemoRadiSam system protein B [Candidatus Omnitrophota bacterium]|nr:AmmeMemoRadiSam system protein B [Candidatus Omnitrophota bacterium]